MLFTREMKYISRGVDSAFYDIDNNVGLLVTKEDMFTQYLKLVTSIYTHITNDDKYIKSFNIYDKGSGIVLEKFDYAAYDLLKDSSLSALNQDTINRNWVKDFMIENDQEIHDMLFFIHNGIPELDDIDIHLLDTHTGNIAFYNNKWILFDPISTFGDKEYTYDDMTAICDRFDIKINDYRKD